MHHRSACRSVSQWCMRCGDHCSLPTHLNAREQSEASVYHATAHVAESTAEMLRPYPLGTAPPHATAVPDATGKSLEATLALLSKDLWTTSRLQSTEAAALSCTGTFLQRFARQHQGAGILDAAQIKLGEPTGIRDLCVAFYYRFLQTKITPHVCV